MDEVKRRLYELKRQARGSDLYQAPAELDPHYKSPRLAASTASYEMYQDMLYMSAEWVMQLSFMSWEVYLTHYWPTEKLKICKWTSAAVHYNIDTGEDDN